MNSNEYEPILVFTCAVATYDPREVPPELKINEIPIIQWL